MPTVVEMTGATVLRAQPVVPLALTACRLKPPTNEPQVRLAALSRSPMLLAVDMTVFDAVGFEQTSPKGSSSLVSVKPPLPSATVPAGVTAGLVTPLVVPANMLSRPGVDGPKLSVQALSLIANFCA